MVCPPKQPHGDAGGGEPVVLKGACEAINASETWVQPSFITHRLKQRDHGFHLPGLQSQREKIQRLWWEMCPGRGWIVEH